MTPSQQTRTMNWIAMPVALILLAMVAYQIYQRHFMPQQLGVNYQFDDLPALNKARVTADIGAIVGTHIFGVIPQTAKQNPVAVEKQVVKPVPKTRLNIKLTGIIDGASPENGIAIVEVDRGRTLVVAVGEKIGKTDASLHQVLPGEILVDRNGMIESVKMVRKTLSMVKLDPELFDNLPQPYIEQANKHQPPAGDASRAGAPTPSSIKSRSNGDDDKESDQSKYKLPVPRDLKNPPSDN